MKHFSGRHVSFGARSACMEGLVQSILYRWSMSGSGAALWTVHCRLPC